MSPDRARGASPPRRYCVRPPRSVAAGPHPLGAGVFRIASLNRGARWRRSWSETESLPHATADARKHTALTLFGLLNFIVEQQITRPKEIGAIYKSLPANALTAIQKRDSSP